MWTPILSLELRGGVDISLKCSIDNICANIDHVWHNWLVLGTVPRYITRLSQLVSVGVLVVLMVDGSLSGSPFSVSIWNGWVLWQNPCNVPKEQVWIIHQCLCLHCIVIHDNWPGKLKTSSQPSNHEVDEPGISEPASYIEVLNWQLSDNQKP